MSSRRDFLSGQTLREQLAASGEMPAAAQASVAAVGETVRLDKPAMASDFEVILNSGPASRLEAASAALDLVDQLEDQMSIYRFYSELSRLNGLAADGPVLVERRLFELLERAVRYAFETDGAFDPTSGPLVALWRQCKKEKRLPSEKEIGEARERRGCEFVEFNRSASTIRFARPGITLNVNAMGKGYALDRAAEILNGLLPASWPGRDLMEAPEGQQLPTPPSAASGPARSGPDATGAPIDDWLMHGGHSSILARGKHTGCEGWPVSIAHPLFPGRQLAVLLLKDRGMSTSGSAVQFFRHEGKRYGHIIDPRTGWPVDSMLSVTVLAPTAADAEALSTAFFVLGVEKAREYCHNHKEIAALLFPAPASGSHLEPVNCGIPEADLAFVPE
jgi:thiamine biosynthesis lipoprotein